MSWKGLARKMGISTDGVDISVFRGTITSGNVIIPNGNVYYVDSAVASSGNGKSWETPYKTIQEAITASNATIDWAATPWLVGNYILVAPGLYAEALTPAYSCTIIGMGVLGTDTGAEIHPASGSALSGTGLGLHLFNLWFETETAVPVIDFGICNNSIIENCVIAKGIAGLATIGIQCDNCTHLQVRNCSFESGVANIATGIQFLGGADKYAHNVRIIDNIIWCVTAGITIASNCTASGAVIAHNMIARPTTGISDANGNSFCYSNWVSAGTDAISHTNLSSRCIDNHSLNNVTGAVEASGTG